jgi:hypothetical protein
MVKRDEAGARWEDFMSIGVELRFTGENAARGQIQLYDVAQALVGFERSLSLTVHAVLNGEVITQSPSLKNAEIFAYPSEEGSWKIVAGIVGAVFAAGQSAHDSVVGHLTYSAYDYVISQALGVHVDFDKTLGELAEEAKSKRQLAEKLTESRLDSVIEKCEVSIRNIHRPISHSHTADKANITFDIGGKRLPLSTQLTQSTYAFIAETEELPQAFERVGFVTSYNVNTFKGRIFTFEDHRPIPFELDKALQNRSTAQIITSSLRSNAIARGSGEGVIKIGARKLISQSGLTKRYLVNSVSDI